MSSAVLYLNQALQRQYKRLASRIVLPPVFLLVLILDVTGIPARSQTDSNVPVVAQHLPEWMDQAIFYEIFPRAFSSAGTLNGVTARLDDLQKLGVNVLWL